MGNTHSLPIIDGPTRRILGAISTSSTTLLLLLLAQQVRVTGGKIPTGVPFSSVVTITRGNGGMPTGVPIVKTVYARRDEVPTVFYNCAVMPNICANIDRVYRLDANKHIDPNLSSIGKNYIELHWDANSDDKKRRREERCGRFMARNSCPQTGVSEPIVGYDEDVKKWPYVDKDGTPRNGAIPDGYLMPDAKIPAGAPRIAYIANNKGDFLGMVWSCEEWPPAS